MPDNAEFVPVDGHGTIEAVRLATALPLKRYPGNAFSQSNAPLGFQVRPTPWSTADGLVPFPQEPDLSLCAQIDGTQA